MGRTNGKLIPFLRNGLEEKSFCNLKWLDKNFETFSLKLPRFEKRKDMKGYEKILTEWHSENNRKYPGYSGAKAVIQAALKKSVYLISLPCNGSQLCFKFASQDEIEENRRKQRDQLKLTTHDQLLKTCNLKTEDKEESNMAVFCESSDLPLCSSSVPSRPVSTSSGYQSGGDDLEEIFSISEKSDIPVDLDDSFLKYIIDDYGQEMVSEDVIIPANEKVGLKDPEIQNCENIVSPNSEEMNVLFSNSEQLFPKTETKLNELTQPYCMMIQDLAKPVEELTPTIVNSLDVLKTYWLCTRKLYIDSLLLLICEKKVIHDETQEFLAGQICFNNVFKPGENSYCLKEMIEVDGKYFIYLLPNN